MIAWGRMYEERVACGSNVSKLILLTVPSFISPWDGNGYRSFISSLPLCQCTHIWSSDVCRNWPAIDAFFTNEIENDIAISISLFEILYCGPFHNLISEQLLSNGWGHIAQELFEYKDICHVNQWLLKLALIHLLTVLTTMSHLHQWVAA